MTLPLILLPPSEGKAEGGEGPPWADGTMAYDLDDARGRVLDALAREMRRGLAERHRLLGVTGSALAAATEANLAVRSSLTSRAIERYTGVLYDALDHRSLPALQRRRLDDCVVIFSGLWGVVSPADAIPHYKLKMGANLLRLGKLSTWWRDRISATISEQAAGRTVWNLLPQEHAAAWRPRERVIQYSIRFVEERPDGSIAVVSHRNKSLKGAFVRFLLAHPEANHNDLAGWQHPADYRLDPGMTVQIGDTTVFTFVLRSCPPRRGSWAAPTSPC